MSPSMPESAGSTATIALLGLPIANLTPSEAVQRIELLARAGRRDGRMRQVATANVDFLTTVHGFGWGEPRHAELLEVLRCADLVTADGMPLVWLARLCGTPLAGRVTGADLVPAIAAMAAKSNLTLFLLCCQSDEQAAQTTRSMESRFPGLRIVGYDASHVHVTGERLLDGPAADAGLIARINAAQPDIVLVGFGHPKQELWVARNRRRLKAGVAIGVGGSLEFLMGRVRRAPPWMQRAGLEWIYRISQQPRRLWRRYARGVLQLAALAIPLLVVGRQARRARSTRGPGQDGAAFRPTRLTHADPLPEQLGSALDLSGLERLDHNGLGQLLTHYQRARAGDPIAVVGAAPLQLRGWLRANRMWDLLGEALPTTWAPPASPEALGGQTLQAMAETGAKLCLPRWFDGPCARALAPAIAAQAAVHSLIIELQAVRYIDAEALAMLITWQRQYPERLVLASIPRNVQRALKVADLAGAFAGGTGHR